MTIWHPDLSGRTGPLARRLADAIGEAVASGALPEGARLPPQRDLAHALGVSLNTVTRAYADATARGFVQGAVGRGTYVRTTAPPPDADEAADLIRPAAGPIDLARNLPTPGAADAALATTLATLAQSDGLSAVLDDQTAGDPPSWAAAHAAAGAQWLAGLGLPGADPDRLVLTTGAQHGILVALLATLAPGDVLLTEALTYAPLKALTRSLGLRIHPVADADGSLSPDALAAACGRVAARALYCLPTLHTPTTATQDAARRAALAEVARAHDLTLIEDDVFGALPPDRPPALATFAPERTLYITSVSKTLTPGLRVGYVLAPPDRVQAVRTAVTLSCWMPPPLMAEIAARWIGDGTAARLTEAQREEAAARQALARDLLTNPDVRADPHGFHVWVPLPPGWQPDAFRAEARSRGVEIVTAGAFAVDPAAAPSAIRLCLSHERRRARVHAGLSVIADLLQGGPPRDTLVL
ncbi:PLP-dependent aminotransferase family protein [Roseospira goensis]|uniref:DNA-binding transcriptional MocR family regulator n=1 Tax=Roseospira goensis TaxID=391922 RepID=A0A7W6RYC9_9PROT|nr:PLP-dependent aminotransferase family protein [Roseospira goensis]MBB4285412.1 DNA-binding transcriptional MocR family regulator [Roseospira goensis]